MKSNLSSENNETNKEESHDDESINEIPHDLPQKYRSESMIERDKVNLCDEVIQEEEDVEQGEMDTPQNPQQSVVPKPTEEEVSKDNTIIR